MKNLKTALAVLLLSGLALPASAGFSGPSKNNAATVAEAKEMPDESYVVCRDISKAVSAARNICSKMTAVQSKSKLTTTIGTA